MSLLHALIDTLSAKQIKTFCETLESNGLKNDLRLFKLTCEFPDVTLEQLCRKFSPENNRTVFNSAKQRLTDRVYEYVTTLELEDDKTKAASIRNMENIAGRLLRHNKIDAASDMYSKAAVEATKNRQDGLLEQVRFRQARLAEKLKLDVPNAIAKWEQASADLAEKRSVEIFRVKLRNEIAQSKDLGDEKDADEMISRIYQNIKITDEKMNDPHFNLELTAMSRDALLSQKKFSSIEPFALAMYMRLQEAGAYDETTIACEIEMILICAHALYRNLKFIANAVWLNKIEQIAGKEMSEAIAHMPKIIGMKAGSAYFIGHLDLAREILEAAMQDKVVKADEKEYYNLTVNLAVNYFSANKFREANAKLMELPSDKYLGTLMGKEWLMKKDMIHMKIQYHLGHDDIALRLLNRAEKVYAELFTKPIYKPSGKFLKLVRRIYTNRDVLKDPRFLKEVESARKSLLPEQDDLHAIEFYCWLKALILRRDYYEVLLERVRRVMDERYLAWIEGYSQQ